MSDANAKLLARDLISFLIEFWNDWQEPIDQSRLQRKFGRRASSIFGIHASIRPILSVLEHKLLHIERTRTGALWVFAIDAWDALTREEQAHWKKRLNDPYDPIRDGLYKARSSKV